MHTSFSYYAALTTAEPTYLHNLIALSFIDLDWPTHNTCYSSVVILSWPPAKNH